MDDLAISEGKWRKESIKAYGNDGKWYFLNDITRGNTGWTRQESAWTVNQQQNPGMPQGALYQSGMTPDGYQVDSQGVWAQK